MVSVNVQTGAGACSLDLLCWGDSHEAHPASPLSSSIVLDAECSLSPPSKPFPPPASRSGSISSLPAQSAFRVGHYTEFMNIIGMDWKYTSPTISFFNLLLTLSTDLHLWRLSSSLHHSLTTIQRFSPVWRFKNAFFSPQKHKSRYFTIQKTCGKTIDSSPFCVFV